MPNRENFPGIFEQLKATLQTLVPPLIVEANTPDNYTLNAPPSTKYPKGLFFGSVQVKKNYVSYHLMPIYTCPDLLAGLSESLKKRMQGKSCFNFMVPDEALFAELKQLTVAGLERFRKAEFM